MAHVFRWPRVFWVFAHVFNGPKVLNPGSCFQRPRIFGSWLMFSGFLDLGLWILAHVFRILAFVFWDLVFLDHGSCFQWTNDFLGFCSYFQWTKGYGSWLMFSKAEDFWILAHVLRGPRVFWAFTQVLRGPKVLDPGSRFQSPRIFGSWLMFSEDQGFFGLWLTFFCGPKVLDPCSCF